MTNERSTFETDDVTDALVSETYRDLARERAPASLNETVLRDARAHGGGYSQWIVWLRPLAWAATVALCLAIVLQIQEDTPVPESPLPALEAEPSPGRGPAGGSAGSVRTEQPAADARKNEPRPDGLRDAAQAPAASEPARRQDVSASSDADAGLSKSTEAAPAAEIDALRVDDAVILEQAEEMARMREGSESRSRAVPTSGSLQSFAAGDAATAPQCSDDSRDDPALWYDCIRALRDAGHEAAAAVELEQLEQAFPDFEPD